ncbi:hypothetical protein ACT18_07660 [Mycolicibacter kumamotonensis]|uniref:Uncharacterized protein n=1 Tax=Mycolicibacter kumamotonensis TaxID=354243 RepID=A0A1B8SHZ5_9MYCO|nr:hypothetical protein ACT18_07660 [Mycolicibacter kumamotonensis]
MDSEVAAVAEDLRTLHRSDPAAADRAIGARLIGLGWQWSWHGLGRGFALGVPLTGRDGLTRASFPMSPLGRLPLLGRPLDRLLPWALDRWWPGQHFSAGGSAGITNTARSLRWLWRVMFPGPAGVHGLRPAVALVRLGSRPQRAGPAGHLRAAAAGVSAGASRVPVSSYSSRRTERVANQ